MWACRCHVEQVLLELPFSNSPISICFREAIDILNMGADFGRSTSLLFVLRYLACMIDIISWEGRKFHPFAPTTCSNKQSPHNFSQKP
jgi:hypothetical protein